MKNKRTNGFTMAEMLIVVAIIAVLGGVSFIAVANHQRSMAQLERDTIAKELFVAAQNHLVMAESQGYLPSVDQETGSFGGVDFGTKENSEDSSTGHTYSNIYSFSVSGGSDYTGNKLLDLMLPFASIDETVRSGGSYIIRYQAKPAIVLDVFYCPKVNSSSGQLRYTHDLGEDTYTDVKEYAGEGTNRKHCLNDDCVLGWYGGTGVEDSGEYIIETPDIKVINKERLIVHITDPNKEKTVSADDTSPLVSLYLILTGEKQGADDTSRAQAAIKLTKNPTGRVKWVAENTNEEEHYEVILDDITTQYNNGTKDGLHFSDLNRTEDSAVTLKDGYSFRPGENITVQAVAYSNSKFANIAYSVEKTTNSLFADPGIEKTNAMIGNFRHLENLDNGISGFNATTLGFTTAEQISDLIEPEGSEEEENDLSWPGFVSSIKTAKSNTDPVKVYGLYDTTGTEDDCYHPVDLTYALSYDGKYHSIEDVKVVNNDDAGLFGKINANGNKVSNLKLIDFSITTSSGNAGALAGTLTNSTVENVVAYHSSGNESKKISTTSGSAGGLIGVIDGTTSVTKSAAAVLVESKNGDAGGLIGKSTSSGSVTGSYSGGHTTDAAYSKTAYNVTATGKGGGLIGDAGSTAITNCYSTCSATGATAGGFVGTTSGPLTDCYCTGLVDGTNKGAFAGELASTGSTSGCSYFEIINEQLENEDYPYLWALGNDHDDDTSVAKIDDSADIYNRFVGSPSSWREAEVYDDNGRDYYKVQKTREDGTTQEVKMYYLGTSVYNAGINTVPTEDTPADFVATHYGDWPAPEIFVVNTQTN